MRPTINSALLRAMVRLASPEIGVRVYSCLGQLPLFDPDLESDCQSNVLSFYRTVAEADALIIASPEYAHGVTGTIKSIDWLVGFEPFASKLVAVLNTSPRAREADQALRETLKTMAAVIVEPASISIPLLGAGLDEEAMLASSTVAEAIRGVLRVLQRSVMSRPNPSHVEFPID